MTDDHQSSPPICTVNPYEYLQMTRNSDGSITRLHEFPSTPAAPDHHGASPVLFKDVPVNSVHNTFVRIFLPRQALDRTLANKLPVIVYYHGGGFILLSASSNMMHDHCWNMADQIAAIVVSVEYRLAPEHRLPAAYDDAMEALHWIKYTNDPWLKEHADISKCFLMGASAGGNIAYNVGLRAASAVNDLEPLKIQGLILIQPFFGGSERSGSELRLINDAHLPLSGTDVMWELSLPNGADRDHEYCNPTVGGGSDCLEHIGHLGWRVLMFGCDGDPLIDRQIELFRIMEMKGVDVVTHFGKGDYHGVDVMDPMKAKILFGFLENFVKL